MTLAEPGGNALRGTLLAHEVSRALFDEAAVVPLSWLADDDSVRWHRPGLISAWVGDEGRWELEERLGVPMDGALLKWWPATAEHEAEDAVLYSLAGEARRLLDPRLISVLRIRLWPLLDLGRDHSSRLAEWVARHVVAVPVPILGADLKALNLAVQPPCTALFQVKGVPTAAQQRLLDVRDEQRARAAARGERIRAAMDAARARAAGRRGDGDGAPDMLPGLVSMSTADTGERR